MIMTQFCSFKTLYKFLFWQIHSTKWRDKEDERARECMCPRVREGDREGEKDNLRKATQWENVIIVSALSTTLRCWVLYPPFYKSLYLPPSIFFFRHLPHFHDDSSLCYLPFPDIIFPLYSGSAPWPSSSCFH